MAPIMAPTVGDIQTAPPIFFELSFGVEQVRKTLRDEIVALVM